MDPLLAHDEFFHVRVVVGIVVVLALARLLDGLARFVQHPYAKYPLWTAFMLLAVVRFWWFELGLSARVRARGRLRVENGRRDDLDCTLRQGRKAWRTSRWSASSGLA